MGILIPLFRSKPEYVSESNQAIAFRRSRDRDWREFASGRYVKRDRVYKTSRFEFDLERCTAYSYGWWCFVKRVGNTIYVNSARYSMQTDLHQDMANNILKFSAPEEHGLKIVHVYYREGLNHLDTAVKNMELQIRQLKAAILKPRSWAKTNVSRKWRIRYLEREITRTKKLNQKIWGKL